jgi:hypothetical protein
MALGEQIKKAVEVVTGFGRPDKNDLPGLIKRRARRLYRFEDDGYDELKPGEVALRTAVRRIAAVKRLRWCRPDAAARHRA